MRTAVGMTEQVGQEIRAWGSRENNCGKSQWKILKRTPVKITTEGRWIPGAKKIGKQPLPLFSHSPGFLDNE